MTGRGEGGGGTEEDGSLSSLVLPLFPLCPHSILIPRSWSLSPLPSLQDPLTEHRRVPRPLLSSHHTFSCPSSHPPRPQTAREREKRMHVSLPSAPTALSLLPPHIFPRLHLRPFNIHAHVSFLYFFPPTGVPPPTLVWSREGRVIDSTWYGIIDVPTLQVYEPENENVFSILQDPPGERHRAQRAVAAVR